MQRRFLMIGFLEETGQILLFAVQGCFGWLRPPYRPALVIDQLYFVANQSVLIICLTALFTGLVFAIQFYFGFQIVQADALVGPASAVSLSKELAPVFSAVVVTGRAGAGMAAELGTMRITEQVDAMEVMAVDPIQYLVSPRILAGVLAVPALSVLFLFVGCVGVYIAGVYVLRIDPVLLFSHLRDFVYPRDVMQGVIKAAVFGLMFSTLSTYCGFFASGGAKGVGHATTRAVVITLVLILISDYFLTLLIRLLLYREGR